MNTETANRQIGERIKDLRRQKGLTQQELADRAELTKGFISQLERGQVSPSVITLLDLIECLGSSPSEFFKETEQDHVVYSVAEQFDKVDANGNRISWIVPSAQGNEMEPLLVTIAPRQKLEEDAPHSGEEFGYVLSGRVTIRIGSKKYDAKAGESFYYKADKPHSLENPGLREAKLLWVSAPPNF